MMTRGVQANQYESSAEVQKAQLKFVHEIGPWGLYLIQSDSWLSLSLFVKLAPVHE